VDEKQITPELEEEATYVLPPHPEGAAPTSRDTTSPGEPTAAEESIPDLIQQAVDGLRGELRAELETQASRIQGELQAELQSELRKEKGGDLNAKT
jgi:hypothetical protein